MIPGLGRWAAAAVGDSVEGISSRYLYLIFSLRRSMLREARSGRDAAERVREPKERTS